VRQSRGFPHYGRVAVGTRVASRPQTRTCSFPAYGSHLAARVTRLLVTFLIGADKLRIGQDVAPHCSLDLRFRRVS
jgi:hypothetical protein